jgi:hypothetical protein
MKRHLHRHLPRHLPGVAALAAVIVVGVSAPAGASGTGGAEQLDALCRDKGGQPYFTPYTISRCQEARSKKGFDVEASICDQLGGTFFVAESQTRPNRSNWACVSGPTTP